jgi:cobalt-zinc-cadmium efflux system membrane fusion protein
VRYPAFALSTFVMLSACGRGSDLASAPAPPSSAPAAADSKEAGVLKIEPGMLRDLRTTTATVETRRGGDRATLLGEVRVNENAYAEIGSPVVARVVALRVSPGDAVRRGQALADLQSTDLGKARSDYVSAKARLGLAEQVLRRKKGLAAEQIVPVREVEEAEAIAESARSDVRAVAAALASLGAFPEDADASGSTLVLRSPIAGSVIERKALQGQMADPSAALFKVADLRAVWLVVHAFERDAVRIATGTDVRVSFPALPGQVFTGRVAFIGREVSVESRTVPVRVQLANPSGQLRPGMSAAADIPVGESAQPLLAVPVAALQRLDNDWVVFVPKDAATYHIRKVGRGRDLGGEVEILSGLEAGETIVVDGSFLLKAEADKARGAGAHEGHEE